MPLTPIPRGIEITLRAHRGGDARVNVFHSRAAGGTPTQAELDANAAAVAAWVSVVQVQNVSNTVVYDTVTARDISVIDGPQSVVSLSGVVGLDPQDPLPGNVCILAHWATTRGGRSGRGRTFWFDSSEAALSGGVWSSVFVSQINAASIALMNDFATINTPMTVLSRKYGTMAGVIAVSVNNNVYSQRDRLPGHRRHRRRRTP
jgi:hypothetical protein